MPQNAENVLDHFTLFRQPEYREMFENKKKNFENPVADDRLEQVREWTKTEEYKEKNFAREALTVNPAKACQPLGAVFAPSASRARCPSFTARRAASPIIAAISRVTSRSRRPASPPP